MNWLNFSLFVLLYAASCVPMYVAGRTEDLKLKTTMLTADALLSIMSFIYLWYAFSTTSYSLTALIAWLLASGYVGKWMRDRGYDPYAAISNRRAEL